MTAEFVTLPDRLPTEASGLTQLIRLLRHDGLADLVPAFVPPRELVQAATRLEFRRITGAGRTGLPSTAPANLPTALLAGTVHVGTPFAFVAESNGYAPTVSVGWLPGRTGIFASGLQAMLSGPEPISISLDETRLWAPSFGCLFGEPGLPDDPAQPVTLPNALDVLMDSLHGEPFTYLVYATPEPPNHTTQLLSLLRSTLTEIEQRHLLTDALAKANRVARHAIDLLEQRISSLERGLIEGLWRVSVLLGTRDAETTCRALPILVGAWRSGESTIPLRGHICAPGSSGYSAHSNIFSPAQLARVCSLPQRDRSGYAISNVVHFDVDHACIADDVKIGQILDGGRPSGSHFTVPTRLLCRHGLLCGHTGSGKSTTARTILAELGRRGIPFMVIDPVKPIVTEYASLAAQIPTLYMLRVGSLPEPGVPAFQLNPLAFPHGFPLFMHVDLLKSTFTASFGLIPPTPYLLETALYRAYRNRGWDTGTGQHSQPDDAFAFPTLSELVAELDQVVNEAGYSEEIRRNLLTALKVRLGNLCIGPRGLSLDTRASLPDEALFDSSVIVELQGLASHEEQALVMGLLLLRLIEVRKVRGLASQDDLSHLLVIEEAHRLLQNTKQRSAEEGNMAYHAIQAFAGLIAEMRAYGQGVLLVEQLPSRLAPEVVKQTSLKIVHRLTPTEDREAVGDAMCLTEDQKKHLAILRTGEAVAHQEGMDGAVLLHVRTISAASAQVRDWDHRWPSGLTKELRKVQEDGARRLRLVPWLRSPEIRKLADSAVIAGLANEPGAAILQRLEQGIVQAFLRATGGRKPEQRAVEVLTRATLQEAILSRYLVRGGSSADWERLRCLLDTAPGDALAELPKVFARSVGPHAWCAACPAPCRYRYDGQTLSKDRDFRRDFSAALTASGEERPTRIVAASRQVQDRFVIDGALLSAAARRALTYCTIGHEAIQIGMTTNEAEDLVNECYSQLS